MRLTMEGLEKERDFYFGKLRDIEVLCQEQPDCETNPALKSITDILYATEVNEPGCNDDVITVPQDGFAAPEDEQFEGNGVIGDEQEEY